MDVETYTAKAESESVTIGRTTPPYMATATGTATGSGTTQVAANIAAEEAAKRASRTAVETVRNITDLVWRNITTGFKKEFPIDDIEYYITFDPGYTDYINGGVSPNVVCPGVAGMVSGSFFWNSNFSGEAYWLVESPTHFQPIGSHFGTISAYIVPDGSVRDEYVFNITANSAINSDAGRLIRDKKYNFSSKMTWVGTLTLSDRADTLSDRAEITTANIGTIVVGILTDDFSSLTGKYNYDSSKTDITLNSPGLALADALGGKQNMVSNAAYDFEPVVLVGINHPTMYRVASSFERSFVNRDPPELGQLVAYGAQDIRDNVVVTELGKEDKK